MRYHSTQPVVLSVLSDISLRLKKKGLFVLGILSVDVIAVVVVKAPGVHSQENEAFYQETHRETKVVVNIAMRECV